MADQQGTSNCAVSRRRFLQSAGAGAAVATGTGLGLFGGKAPAFAQGTTLHVLQPSNFAAEIDVQLRALATEFEQAHHVTMKLEFINLNDVLPRAHAAVQVKTGPDVILLRWNQAWRFGEAFLDVGDIVHAMGGTKVHRFNRDAVNVAGVYRGVPFYNIGSAMTYNLDLLKTAGVTGPPDTYEDLLRVGAAMKKAGYPVGWCLGHTIDDGAIGSYPIVWAFGGAEVDEKGQVTINSKETQVALEWFRQFWNDACDPSGLAWNDSGNNRAFLGQTVSIVLNAASIYQKARGDKNDNLADAIRHTVAPAGPAGRHGLIQPFNHHIPAYSRNSKAAQAWLTFLGQQPHYERVFRAGRGFVQGISPQWDAHPLWKEDPLMEPYKDLARYGRSMGYKGTYNRASSEVQAKYIVVDMLARSVRDGSNAALRWGENELKRVYEAG